MRSRFTEGAVRCVHTAVQLAESRDDKRIGTEHLLLGVMGSRSPVVDRIIDVMAIDQVRLLSILEDFDEGALADVGIEATAIDATSGLDWTRRRRHRPFTRAAKDTLSESLEEAKLLRHRHLGPEHILLALSSLPDHDITQRILAATGWERTSLRNLVLSELRKPA